MPNEETVERPHGAEPELDCRPAKFVAPQEPQVSAEIIPLQCLPRRSLLPLRLVPAMKLQHRLPVVPLRVGRSAPIRGQVLQELIDPLVVDRRLSRGCAKLTGPRAVPRSEEHTSELQSLRHIVCR